MNNIIKISLMLVIFILIADFGYKTGYGAAIEEQKEINERLRVEYEELKIQYDRDLNACYLKGGMYG